MSQSDTGSLIFLLSQNNYPMHRKFNKNKIVSYLLVLPNFWLNVECDREKIHIFRPSIEELCVTYRNMICNKRLIFNDVTHLVSKGLKHLIYSASQLHASNPLVVPNLLEVVANFLILESTMTTFVNLGSKF